MSTTLSVSTLDLISAATSKNPSTSRLSSNVSFALSSSQTQVLWAQGQQNGPVQGLFYVPDLPSASQNTCYVGVPQNVTRKSNIPSNAALVAVAPWVSGECARQYLAAAQSAYAMMFYLPPKNSNDTSTPPPPSSTVWNLPFGQGPGDWEGLNNLPIYALASSQGDSVVQALGQYSGNITSVPNSTVLLEQGATTDDWIRLFASFNTTGSSHYPTLWAFLLIILGIVLVLLGITSLSMRIRQRRNRNSLRRRIGNGQVDLDILFNTGPAKRPPRMTRADVDAMELVTYTPSPEKPPLPLDTKAVKAGVGGITPAVESAHDYNQPTCPICLDDYVPNDTKVRVLPCYHIYHPECIDPHLLSSNSLCPVCKKAVPTSASAAQANAPSRTNIPPITNALVRRERYIRRERAIREGRMMSPGDWFHRYLGSQRYTGSRPVWPAVGGVRVAERRQSRPTGTRSAVLTRRAPSSNFELTTTPSQLETGIVQPQTQSSSVPTLPPSATADSAPPTTEIPQQPLSSISSMPSAPAPQHFPPPQSPTSPTSPSQTFFPRPPRDTEAHREWSRRRASSLLHRNSRAGNTQRGSTANDNPNATVLAAIAEEEQRHEEAPPWRRGLRKVFPGF